MFMNTIQTIVSKIIDDAIVMSIQMYLFHLTNNSIAYLLIQ